VCGCMTATSDSAVVHLIEHKHWCPTLWYLHCNFQYKQLLPCPVLPCFANRTHVIGAGHLCRHVHHLAMPQRCRSASPHVRSKCLSERHVPSRKRLSFDRCTHLTLINLCHRQPGCVWRCDAAEQSCKAA
jgi:hypothetical protein